MYSIAHGYWDVRCAKHNAWNNGSPYFVCSILARAKDIVNCQWHTVIYKYFDILLELHGCVYVYCETCLLTVSLVANTLCSTAYSFSQDQDAVWSSIIMLLLTTRVIIWFSDSVIFMFYVIISWCVNKTLPNKESKIWILTSLWFFIYLHYCIHVYMCSRDSLGICIRLNSRQPPFYVAFEFVKYCQRIYFVI